MSKCIECDNEAQSDGSWRCAYHNKLKAEREAAEAHTEYIREQRFRQENEDRKQRQRDLADLERKAFIEHVREQAELKGQGYEKLEELQQYAKERGLSPVYFFRYSSVDHDLLKDNIPDVEAKVQKIMGLIHSQFDATVKNLKHDEKALVFSDYVIDHSIDTTIKQVSKAIEENRDLNSRLRFYSAFQIGDQWYCPMKEHLARVTGSSGYEGKRVAVTDFNNVLFVRDSKELFGFLQKLETEASDTMAFAGLVSSLGDKFSNEKQKPPLKTSMAKEVFKKWFLITSVGTFVVVSGIVIWYSMRTRQWNNVPILEFGTIQIALVAGAVTGFVFQMVHTAIGRVHEQRYSNALKRTNKQNQATANKLLLLLDEIYRKVEERHRGKTGFLNENS